MKPSEWILVTGATRRLGLAITQRALEMGYGVVLHYRTTPEPARRRLRANPAWEEQFRFIRCSLDAHHAAELIEQAAETGPLAGLVNNASVFTPGALDDADHLASILDTNTFVPLALSRRFVRLPAARWILNITDAHIDTLATRFQNYRLSKQWLEQLTRQMAAAWAPSIRVNALAPGAILPPAGTPRSAFARLASSIPLKRTGTVAHIADGFQFLTSHSYITGQTLYIDGGWHLCP